jgi:hypothetical protein
MERLLRSKKHCKPYSSVSSKAKLACRKRLDEIARHQSRIAIQVFQKISKFMEPLERHQIAYLGVCCTTEQKDLLLMTKVVKNFFGNDESKTELVSVCVRDPKDKFLLRNLCCAGKRSVRVVFLTD